MKHTRKLFLGLLALGFVLAFIRIHRTAEGVHIETRYYSIAVTTDF